MSKHSSHEFYIGRIRFWNWWEPDRVWRVYPSLFIWSRGIGLDFLKWVGAISLPVIQR